VLEEELARGAEEEEADDDDGGGCECTLRRLDKDRGASFTLLLTLLSFSFSFFRFLSPEVEEDNLSSASCISFSIIRMS
jgi:hypothetical protein